MSFPNKIELDIGMWVTLAMVLIYTLSIGAILLLNAESVMSLFTSDPNVIRVGALAMQYFCPFYFILGILHALAGAVRGTGRTVPPMIIMLAGMCVFPILWLQAVLPQFHSIPTVFMIYPLSWAVSAMLMLIYTLKAHWLA
ncbi:MAG: MATE family efflux transporter [Aerococcus sp.]|nr:MATE family efflux transporter [Aerococcus sp.]